MSQQAVEPTQQVGVEDVKVKSPENGVHAHAADKDPDNNNTDDLAPADDLITWHADGAVKLRMTDTYPGNAKPTTIPTLFEATVQKCPERTALAVKRNDKWVKWTFEDYLKDVIKAAKSFIKLGLDPYHGVGILGFNSPEWFIADLGVIYAGGLAVGIYTTNSPEACQYVLENSCSQIVIVENNVQLQKILKVWDKLPHLKAIVQYTDEVAEKKDNIYSWADFMKLGHDVPESSLQERRHQIAPNKAATLIYTSGTTGNPKGVMISHDNMTWTAIHAADSMELRFGCESVVSYLPLSHIAAQVTDIISSFCLAISVYFARPDALKGTLVETLKEVHPTSFLAVPRVWEKMQESMMAVGRQTTGMKKKIATWAKGVGLRGSYAKINGHAMPWGWTLANALVFKKVHAALGLDHSRICLTSAAPITKDTLEYFLSLNIMILEVYGMSEMTGPHTFNTHKSTRITSIGKEFSGAKTKLRDCDADGNGEICCQGRHIFMGYLNTEEKTRETFDDDMYLRTGDIGKIDEDGFMYITGRIKEIIITAGGENIAPFPIEETVKLALPCVSNCMLIGDKRKFLSMLLTFKTDIDVDTQVPKDTLTDVSKSWCQSIGSNATTVSQILDDKDEKVLNAIQAGITEANKKAVSNAQKVQKWSLLRRDFSIPGGELGPTLKLRRPIVCKMYHETIEAFYKDT